MRGAWVVIAGLWGAGCTDASSPFGSCASNAVCDSDEYCWVDGCRPVFGEFAELFVEIVVTSTGWDVDFSDPDVYVTMEAEADSCTLPTKNNRSSMDWIDPCILYLEPGSLHIEVVDEDAAQDDLMLEGTFSSSDMIGLARGDIFGLYNDYVSVSLNFIPL
jgi:hypothetical protein